MASTWDEGRRHRVRASDPGCLRSTGLAGVVAAGAFAVLLAAAYLLAPPMGRDHSARLSSCTAGPRARGKLLDLRWYGGYEPLAIASCHLR